MSHCSRSREDDSLGEGVASPLTSMHIGILSHQSFSMCSCITSSDCVLRNKSVHLHPHSTASSNCHLSVFLVKFEHWVCGVSSGNPGSQGWVFLCAGVCLSFCILEWR